MSVMSTAETRRDEPATGGADTAPLYERDFVAWAEDQAALLRSGRFDLLDLANLIEELEGMGRSDRRQLYTRLEVLLTRFLKRDFQPERHSRSWDITIGEQRRRLLRLLRESPSLKHGLGELIAEAYQGARDQASLETGLPIGTFPEANPYATAEIFAGRL
jgi:hypothetical protein